jgi:TPP-dependent pyruvate/acetoin dehydrogenase alpha subunit
MNSDITKELAIEFYRKMKLIRRFEENVVELVNKNEIYGTTHECVGQEAVAVGVCSALEKDDYITSNHRGHGHLIAKGGDVRYMFAELMGKVSGYNRGTGGSMHISEPGLGILGANGIVGAGVPIAVGAALAVKMKKSGHIIAAFFGDGASNQGVVHEAMNMAAIWKLPVLFVCENNRYAVSTPVEYAALLENLSERSDAYGFKGATVNGMKVDDVYYASLEAVNELRAGRGPILLECKTYRFHGHFTAEPYMGLHYRSDEEIGSYMEKCPVDTWAKRIVEDKVCSARNIAEIDENVEKLIEKGIDFARKSAFPAPENAFRDMYASEYGSIPRRGTE